MRSLTRNQTVAFIGLVLGLVLAVFFGAPSLYFGYLSWRDARSPHAIVATAGPPRFKDDEHGEYYVTVGSNSFRIWPNAWAKNGHTYLLSDSIDAYIKDDQIVVNAHLYAENGKSVGVADNKIINAPGWDRNFDDSALEIVNDSGTPILQVIYNGPHYAVIYGVFVADNGDLVQVVTPEVIAINPTSIRDVKGFPLRRLFRYPSRLYPGLEVGTE